MQAYLYLSPSLTSLYINLDFVVQIIGGFVVVEHGYPKTSISTYVVGAGLQVAIAAYNSENLTTLPAPPPTNLSPPTEVFA